MSSILSGPIPLLAVHVYTPASSHRTRDTLWDKGDDCLVSSVPFFTSVTDGVGLPSARQLNVTSWVLRPFHRENSQSRTGWTVSYTSSIMFSLDGFNPVYVTTKGSVAMVTESQGLWRHDQTSVTIVTRVDNDVAVSPDPSQNGPQGYPHSLCCTCS
ncbi:hypothetical protein BaRGS_00038542 [Batillaria attramentaria]|uniref:Uncharacterized protein n=1 Tax=Batillaria attramentaria TaxID=370345 RepID=A0ABD0J5J9_9CAEN